MRKFAGGFTALVGLFVSATVALNSAAEEHMTDALGYIPYWIGAGPWPVDKTKTQKQLIEAEAVPGEANLAPVVGDPVKIGDREFKWKPVTVKDGKNTVDGEASFGKADNVLVYLIAYVVLDKDEPTASAYWSCDDNGAVFINGSNLSRFAWDGGRGYTADSDVVEQVALKKGVNVIMIKLINMGLNYFAGLRLVDSDGNPLAGARLVMAPEGKKAPEDATWPAVKTPLPVSDDKVNSHIIVSQIGYNTGEEKLAVATGKKSVQWKSLNVCDSKTGKAVFNIPKDGGSIKRMGYQYKEGEYVTRIYFGKFDKPGRYFLSSDENEAKSLNFNIAENVFSGASKEIIRAFYFQRHGQERSEKNAGKWTGKAYHDPELAKKARVHAWGGGNWLGVGGKVIDETERDVRGGWYDAGDPNKYTKNEVCAHNWFLLAYDMNKGLLKDGDLNIPESGNGVPDLLDEARYATEYLLRIQRDDGAVFDRVAHGDGNSTPQIAETCSGATLCTISAWAWAAAVWQETGLDKKFAKRCLEAAEKSWNYLEKNPGPWPLDDKGKPKNIGSIDWGYGDTNMWRTLAAATLFRATGRKEFGVIAENFLKSRGDLRTQWNAHEMMWNPDDMKIIHNYMLSKGADNALVEDAGRKLRVEAELMRDEVSPARRKHLYGSGSRDGYYWGVNSAVSTHASQMAWWAWKFAPESDKAGYAQAAGEYFQFLLGRNASRWCFVTNLKHVGAERSITAMFHFLCRTDELMGPCEAKPGRLGCFPGYIIGGPAFGPANFDFDPSAKKEALDYFRFEPSIMYQGPGVCLAAYVSYLAVEHRRAKK